MEFRQDLFRGTTEHYERFRPPYPTRLIDDLRARVPLRGDSRVLDLACGTGQIAFALAAHVGEVWAVDQEPEMVEFGARKAQRLGAENIRWVTAAAEEVALAGSFDFVAIGNAFQRLDRDAVARRLVRYLGAGGCVALLWGGTPWNGDQSWQRVLQDTFERWMDALDAHGRVPAGWEQAMTRDPHEQVLRRAGLVYEGKFEFEVVGRWTIDALIGFVYSTSFLNRAVLKDRADEFEHDLRARLATCAPDGVFEQHASWAYELARATAACAR